MPQFLKSLRLKSLLVLALISMPVFVQACFTLTQPPTPIFTKQGSTIFATYTVTGNVVNLAVKDACRLFDAVAGDDGVVNSLGYTYNSVNFSFTNGKSQLTNCTPNIGADRRLVFTQITVGTCSVSFKMVYPLTGSYTGNNPSTDFIFAPRISFRTPSTFSSSTAFTKPIPIPSEPARTCSLTHPSIVTMADRQPSDFPSNASTSSAGSFSVTLSCPATTSARSGTPSLIFSYPTTFVAFNCSATNQADPAVASPVLALITRLDNRLVCGTSAISSSVQNFASFDGTGGYTSTLDFKTFYISPKANPGPGVFTASITLQVQYP